MNSDSITYESTIDRISDGGITSEQYIHFGKRPKYIFENILWTGDSNLRQFLA